jgi:class 3 adenylate cyclase
MMLAALECWNAERRTRGERRLAIGIGLDYGPAVLGDIGSDHSFSLTVIGDTVNTASRLQRLTRAAAAGGGLPGYCSRRLNDQRDRRDCRAARGPDLSVEE